MIDNKSITELIQEAKELDAAATPGPWINDDPDASNSALIRTTDPDREPFRLYFSWKDQQRGKADAEFIARARTLLPALVAALETLKQNKGERNK